MKNNFKEKNTKMNKKPLKPIKKRLDVPKESGKEGIEYTMTEALAKNILASDKSKDKTPQEKLCNWVNENCGLNGYCISVSYF